MIPKSVEYFKENSTGIERDQGGLLSRGATGGPSEQGSVCEGGYARDRPLLWNPASLFFVEVEIQSGNKWTLCVLVACLSFHIPTCQHSSFTHKTRVKFLFVHRAGAAGPANCARLGNVDAGALACVWEAFLFRSWAVLLAVLRDFLFPAVIIVSTEEHI